LVNGKRAPESPERRIFANNISRTIIEGPRSRSASSIIKRAGDFRNTLETLISVASRAAELFERSRLACRCGAADHRYFLVALTGIGRVER
jgi:hypothetical protein